MCGSEIRYWLQAKAVGEGGGGGGTKGTTGVIRAEKWTGFSQTRRGARVSAGGAERAGPPGVGERRREREEVEEEEGGTLLFTGNRGRREGDREE